MTRRIYEYALYVGGVIHLPIPDDAQILCVQAQYDQPYIWALLDPEDTNVGPRIFVTCGTGHEVPDGPGRLSYIGSYQLVDSAFVGHVFERVSGYMTPNTLRYHLERLYLSQQALARLLDINERTVRRWAAGELEIPEDLATIIARLTLADVADTDSYEGPYE